MELTRHKTLLIWVGLVALSLVYAIFSIETAPSFLACMAEPAGDSPGIFVHGRCGWRVLYSNRDGIAAAATVLIAVAAWMILAATRRIARGAQDTAQRATRAYLMVSKARVELEVGQLPRFKITLRNFGQTPAYDVVQWSNVGFDFFPATVDFEWGLRDDKAVRAPLAPGAALHTYPMRVRPLLAHEMEELAAGDAALYVTGTITYRDAFGENRVTQYCLLAGGPVGVGGTMMPYHEGNHAN